MTKNKVVKTVLLLPDKAATLASVTGGIAFTLIGQMFLALGWWLYNGLRAKQDRVPFLVFVFHINRSAIEKAASSNN